MLDTASISFSGNQTAAFKTSVPYPAVTGTLKVSLAFNPAESSTSEFGTLLRYGTQWELRYSYNKQTVSLIVWDGGNNYTDLPVPCPPGEWHKIEAKITPESLTLKVGTDQEEVPYTAGLFQADKPARLLLGASRAESVEGDQFRPLAGSLAAITIEQD